MTSNPILHTERFNLIPWKNIIEHNIHLIEMMRDEEVMRYIIGHSCDDLKINSWILEIEKTNNINGLGYWLIFEENVCVGVIMFTILPQQKENYIEISYWLKPQFWGRGIASEVASCLICYGFRSYNHSCIVAVTNPKNIASQKSLLSAGMKHQGNIIAYNAYLPFYIIENLKSSLTIDS